MKRISTAILLLSMGQAHSFYASRLVNKNLRDQVIADNERILPMTERLAMAVDGHMFYRPGGMNDKPGFWHGGYWIDPFIEYRPNSKMTVNVRYALYNPAASYGAVSHFDAHPFVSVSWKDALRNYFGDTDWKIDVTVADLGRQTIGAGLNFDQKEMSGAIADFTKKHHRFRYLFHGTGGYNLIGDLISLQYDYRQGRLGFYTFQHQSGQAPFYSVFSHQPISENWRYFAEYSYRNAANAYMLGFEGKHSIWKKLYSNFKLQGRYYGNHYAARIEERVQHDFLAITQEDKDFTEAPNIFVQDDNVTVYAARWDLKYFFSDRYGFFTSNEYSQWNFNDRNKDLWYFYRHGLFTCPLGNQNECIQLLVTNKISSAFRGPQYNHIRTDQYTFLRRRTYSVEAVFHF